MAIHGKEPAGRAGPAIRGRAILGPATLGMICWIACSGTALWGGPREDFLKLIDRPRVPLAPEVTRLADADGLEQFHFTFQAEAGPRVPGILIRPKSAAGSSVQPRPAVICLHGTGGRKEECVPLLRELASQGFLGVAIDGPFHGERTATGSYDDAIRAPTGPARGTRSSTTRFGRSCG